MKKLPIVFLSQNDFSSSPILDNDVEDVFPTIPQLDGAVKNVFYGWSNIGRDEKMFWQARPILDGVEKQGFHASLLAGLNI